MKKHLLLMFLLSCLLSTGYSQDKIITLKNDTIDCKINKISRNSIFFELTTKGAGKIPLSDVMTYTVSGNYSSARAEYDASDKPARLRLSIDGGPGIILASSKYAEEQMTGQGFPPNEVKSYYRDLRSGISGNADLIYMITPDYGAGIRYRYFNTAASIEGFVDPGDGVHLYYTTYSENIYVNYAGVSFFEKMFPGNRNKLNLNYTGSLGMSMYRNEAGYLNGYYLLTGKSLGADLSLGLEYFVTKRISLGAGFSAFYSSLRKMKVSDGSTTSTVKLDKENFENLTRLDISAGIRFYIW